MDLNEAHRARGRVVARVLCADCNQRSVLGEVFESPAGYLYVPEREAAMESIEARIAGDVRGQIKRLPGMQGRRVDPPTLLDIALIADGAATLAEPRSSFAPAPDLIAWCREGHRNRPLTVDRIETAIDVYQRSARIQTIEV